MARRWTPESRRLELIQQLHDGSRDILQVAELLNMDLVSLAQLAGDEQLATTASTLRQLGHWRLESFLARYQIHAIARLVELSNQTDDLELARKASVDLVKANLTTPPSLGAMPQGPGSAEPAVDTMRVLEMLSELGGPGTSREEEQKS